MSMDLCQAAFSIINQMHALVACWSADEKCTFSNRAFQSWFGRPPEEMAGVSLSELLGPAAYEVNRRHIQGALCGQKQIFEQHLTHSSSRTTLRFLVTFTPDPAGDAARGFSLHATELPAETRLRAWMPICSSCKDIQSSGGEWHPLEDYFSRHSGITFTHGLCPKCMPRYFPCPDDIVTSI